MSTVADDERRAGSSTSLWLTRGLTILAILVVAGLLAALVLKLIHGAEGPKRQTTKIALLPDAPPPPPPPPPREEPKKEPPKEQSAKPVPQDQPKAAPAAPVNRDVHSDEAAGNGNSPFTSGNVSNDGLGGPAGGASSPVGPAPLADRTRDRFYANNAKQSLHDEIERQLKPEAGELSASLLLWIEPDGRIRRLEVTPGGGASEGDLQAALDGTARELRLDPPPTGLPQPLRFRLTVRSQS